MLYLKANGYTANLMRLARHEGRASTLQVSVTAKDVEEIVEHCGMMIPAIEDEVPEAARLMKGIVDNLRGGQLSVANLAQLLERMRITLGGELAQRRMWIMMPGEEPPTQAVEAPKSKTPASAGGRPPKAWWEDLLIEISRQLWAGDLKPERQADIEKAMHDWIMANGHSAGETQVRERARKFFNALNA